MAEPKRDFAVHLLAGINGDLKILEPHFDSIRVESRDFRLAWGLVEFSHGLRTLSSLEIMWPNCKIEKVLTNPEVAALVERIGERPDLKIQGQQKLVSRTLDAALEVIGSRLEATDVGIHHARDVAELAIKIDTLGSSFKCNTQSPLGIGCCNGHTKQAPQQRGPWRDISRA